MSSTLRIAFLSLLFVVIWSSGWIGAKYQLNFASALGALTWRYLFVVYLLFMFVSVLRLWQFIEPRELAQHAIIGLLSHTGFLSLSIAAMDSGVSAGMVAFISALQPVFTLAFAYPVLQEKINLRQATGIVLGVLSMCMVIGEKITLGGSVYIYCLPVLSVLALIVASVYSRYNEKRNVARSRKPTPLLLVLLIQCGAAFGGFFLLTLSFGSFTISMEPKMFGSMAYMVLVLSIGSYYLYFLLLRELPVVKVASLVYLTPPVTMLFGWVLYRESLSVTDMVGLLIALVAVILISRGNKDGCKTQHGVRIWGTSLVIVRESQLRKKLA